jgi:hypothetical protein
MGRLSASLPALVLAAVLALGLSACGGGGSDLLPGTTASEINSNLDEVRQLVGEGDCVGATDAAGTVSTQVEELNGVDKELKEALSEGAARLSEVVAACEEAPSEDEEEAQLREAEEAEAEEEAEEKAGEKREKEEEKAEKDEEKEAQKEEKGKGPAVEPPGQEKKEELPPEEEVPPVETEADSGGIGPGEQAGGG